MYFWITGVIAGVLPVAWVRSLPDTELVLAFAAGSAAWLLSGLFAGRFLFGLGCGLLVAVSYGQAMQGFLLPTVCVGEPVRVTGTISSLASGKTLSPGLHRQRFELTVEQILPARCAGPRTLLLSYYGDQSMQPGQRWRFASRLKRPWGLSNPGSHNMQAWFAQTGIHALGNVRGAQRLGDSGGWRTWHHRQRQRIGQRIEQLALGPGTGSILKALTIGDKSAVDHKLWRALQYYGINHLIVISGLHVGLVAGVGYLLGALVSRVLGSPPLMLRCCPALGGLLFAAFYAALAGFSLPTQRALWMLVVFAVAQLSGRRSQSWRALLLAILLILTLNPLAGLGSGFWLSVAAVAMLLWISHWHQGHGKFVSLVTTHGFMCLLMLPLGAAFFDGGSQIAVLSNLVMIPLIGSVVVPAALLASLAHLAQLTGIESVLWQVAAWPLRQILLPLLSFGTDHGAWMYRAIEAGPVAVALAVTAVVLWVLPVSMRLKLATLILFLPLWLPPRGPDSRDADELRVTVLDVGQGTAVVVRAGSNTLLYDTGGGDPAGQNLATTVVLPYLRSVATSSLNTFVISHPDLDHSAGARDVLAAYPVDRLRYGSQEVDYGAGMPCRAGEAWQWPGPVRFQILSPAGEEGLARNDSSCVLQIEYAGYRLLLPGDVEQSRERQLARYWGASLASDWLLVGHHGSRTSTSWPLLKQALPAFGVISNGYANRFGHPHDEVVRRLRAVNTAVASTAESGALTLYIRPGRPVRVDSHRQKYQRYWM